VLVDAPYSRHCVSPLEFEFESEYESESAVETKTEADQLQLFMCHVGKTKGFSGTENFPDCKPFVFITLTLDKVFLVLWNERKTRQWSS